MQTTNKAQIIKSQFAILVIYDLVFVCVLSFDFWNLKLTIFGNV